MNLPLIILGAGGHAKVLIDALRGAEIRGLTDPGSDRAGQQVLGVPWLGADDVLSSHPPDAVQLVNGLGTVRVAPRRRALFELCKAKGYRFATVVHASAVIASDVDLAEGTQVMAGAVVQAGSQIGENTIINTGAVVDHDCRVGRHVHIASGAVLSGYVDVGDRVHIGAGATVIQGIRIGAGCLIGAGAVVIRDVLAGATVVGVPAREIKS